MEAHEVLKIHKMLWRETPPSQIKYEGQLHNVTILNTQSRKFRSVNIDGRLIITQNMAKPTANTTWVNQVEGRQLTWIIVNDSYMGKITTEPQDDSSPHFKVFKLNPERVVYETTEKGG